MIDFDTINIDGIGPVGVEYEFLRGEPGCLTGPADNWVEPVADEITVLWTTTEGRPFSLLADHDALADTIRERLERRTFPCLTALPRKIAGLYCGTTLF